MADSSTEFVDSHFHIWDLKKFEYPWPTEEEKAIFRNFTIHDYETSIRDTQVKYGVFIQCLHDINEAKWVMEQGKTHSCIKGVVAGVDLTDNKLKETLDDLQKNSLFKGVRHILDFEEPTWITRDDVHKGLNILQERNLTYDLLLRPPLLKYIPSVVEKFPSLKFAVDHIAKPYIKDKKFDPWRTEMAEIAKHPNVYCKISGMVTEADWESWKPDDFKPYVEHIMDIFGIDRCMFGSDWPVCGLANAKFADVFSLLKKLFPSLNDEEKLKLFRNNAIKFYNLDI